MPNHPVVSHEEWLVARRKLLAREREETRLRDAVNAERLALPWERVDKDYRFQTPAGERSLGELFAGRRQLLIYHFMLAPGWEAGCTGCSFLSDHVDGALPHLEHHDVTWTAVSRAPLAEIARYKERMGWAFPWVSSNGSDFNYDYGVSFDPERGPEEASFNYAPFPAEGGGEEQPGLSAFWRDPDGTVFHTYSSYTRGLETIIGTLMILDRTPLGRNEGSTMDFVRRHDEYADAPAGRCCHGAAAE
jgi:predicted dithiol-disulfide oxidoreductase (DUF899 family)